MEKIILFGASSFGQRALTYWQQQENINIIAFSDNDKKKHHSLFSGINVIPPADILKISFDKIVITSSYDKQISQQLVDMGINPSKITMSSVDTISTLFDSDNRLLMAEELMFYITELFNNHHIDYHLDHGTLLGIIRDKTILPWDKDIDFAVPEQQQDRVISILEKHLNYYKSKYCQVNNWKYKVRYDQHVRINKSFTLMPVVVKILNDVDDKISNKFELDIKFKYEYDSKLFWTVGQRTLQSDIGICFPTNVEFFKNKEIRVPKNPKQYLKSLYGNWQVTVKQWTYNQYTNISE